MLIKNTSVLGKARREALIVPQLTSYLTQTPIRWQRQLPTLWQTPSDGQGLGHWPVDRVKRP